MSYTESVPSQTADHRPPHREAMEMVDRADEARRRGDLDAEKTYMTSALALEERAIQLAPAGLVQGVLCRSAATIAYRMANYPKALALTNAGLESCASHEERGVEEIRAELETLAKDCKRSMGRRLYKIKIACRQQPTATERRTMAQPFGIDFEIEQSFTGRLPALRSVVEHAKTLLSLHSRADGVDHEPSTREAQRYLLISEVMRDERQHGALTKREREHLQGIRRSLYDRMPPSDQEACDRIVDAWHAQDSQHAEP